MPMIGNPPQGSNPDSVLGIGWQEFFSNVYTILFANTQSGPTSARPINRFWIGRRYFDTDLGIPIWYNGTAWVNASGGIV